ncbi:MAG: hypothetical protein HY520_03125 [Candidatus Aenigmarchaeota archaeon]|nr:hypothetical protein [Candidatus Aenigmarchaeota archaeon]
MKVRELKNFLELQAGEARAGQLLQTYSHWIAALFQAREYVVGSPKDLPTLHRLAELKLVILHPGARTVAELTPAGKKLYQDFYGHGYY